MNAAAIRRRRTRYLPWRYYCGQYGVKLAYNGGWHDAGDVSQQTLQTAEVVHSLLETAERVKQEEPSLCQRILEEAVWGLDFILRMRFSDGYRATSAGIRRWSDGFIGNMDDCRGKST